MNEIKPQWKSGTVQELFNLTDSEILEVEALVQKVKLIKGDLIQLYKEGKFDIIIHGCNCFHTMGAGIAKTIKENFPEVYQADVQHHERGKNVGGDWTILGPSRVSGVVNFYTQFAPGANFDINYLKECCESFYLYLEDNHVDEDGMLEIGFPWIGCGIGGGDKMEVLKVLADLNNGYGEEKICNVTIVEL